MATFSWGLPGITLDPPPLRDGQAFPAFPPPWNRLIFGPVGLYELRRKLGVHAAEPGVFQRYRQRFLTADIAWFAAGASTDGQHRVGQPGFFPALELLRRPLVTGPEGSQIRRALSDQMQVAIWDMATTWDRAFGGTTMIMHIDGTTRPNTPAEPQYLRAPTYLPPAFVAAHPDSHAPIARIVQTFIEAVGVPTVVQWRLNAQRLNWSLTQAGMSGSVNTPSNQLIPPPRPNSSLYHFFGRHPGTLDALIASPPSSSRPAILIDDDDDYDNDLNEASFALMDALERASYAEEQATQRLIRINELEEQVNVLLNQVNTARRAAPSAPTTPARSRATPQHTPQRAVGPIRGGPPPYSPSVNPRSPLALSPDRLRAEISPGDNRLDGFIEAHGLGNHAAAIKLVIRVFNPVKWYEELENLGIPAANEGRLIGRLKFKFPLRSVPAAPTVTPANLFKKIHLHPTMPAVYTTVAAASAARRRPDEPPKKTAPLTAEQQKEKRDARADKQARMDAKVRKWMEDTNALANSMAEEFDVKPRYILDIFFQGGAHMIHHQEVTNPYNAFKALKAAEVREAGESKDAQELHLDYFDEYNKLTEEERKKLVTEYDKIKERNFSLRRDTPRAKIQDVSNVVRNMKMLMYGMAQRVGIEGFFCVVRNNVEFKMEPEWYFTSRELENYMEIATRKRWVTGEIGAKLEAFAIAGCDPVNMLRTAKQKIDFMKGEIRARLSKGLEEVSKVPDARLAWTWFEEDVIQRYDVVLEGWTAGSTIVDPSKLSSSQTVIRTLLEAVKSGDCAFRKLGPTEAAARRKKWDEDVASGKAIAKHRAARSDAGVPRKRTHAEREGEGEGDESDENTAPAAISTPPGAPTKRLRTGHNEQRASTVSQKKKAPAANKNKAVPRKQAPAASASGTRNDATTAAALKRLKESRPRPRITSNAIITSEDERDDDPEADEEGDGPAAAATDGTAAATDGTARGDGTAQSMPTDLFAFGAPTDPFTYGAPGQDFAYGVPLEFGAPTIDYGAPGGGIIPSTHYRPASTAVSSVPHTSYYR